MCVLLLLVQRCVIFMFVGAMEVTGVCCVDGVCACVVCVLLLFVQR